MAGNLARGGEGYTRPSQYYPDNKKHGNYQLINLIDVINNFVAAYTGEGKILQDVLKGDVAFHAHRAIQELSYDTFKSCKSQEIVLPPSLQMTLPHDYVNYTKITWSDSNGIEHIIYPTSKTSNPNTIQQDSDGNYVYSKGPLSGPGGKANLVQDETPKVFAMGYQLDNGYGITYATNQLDVDYSGPFRLKKNYVYYHEDDDGNLVAVSEDISGPVLKDGMQIFHIGMQPNTTITDVTRVNVGSDKYTTEFYINKPTYSIQPSNQNNEIRYVSFDDISGDTTWGKYKSSGGNQVAVDQSTTTNLSVDADNYFQNTGQRYGLDGQYAQANGSFFIDCNSGKIHFSSNLSGKTIILHYLSDRVGDEKETMIPKLAEEAIYKWIAYGCLSARADVPEHIVARFKKERYAETRKAKLRLSNIKIEEITQVIRGKSKWIKH
jgi:hypothetical protein